MAESKAPQLSSLFTNSLGPVSRKKPINSGQILPPVDSIRVKLEPTQNPVLDSKHVSSPPNRKRSLGRDAQSVTNDCKRTKISTQGKRKVSNQTLAFNQGRLKNVPTVSSAAQQTQHSQSKEHKPENDEKATRSVFVANLPISIVTSKIMRRQFLQYLANLGSGNTVKADTIVESIRFRSVPFGKGVSKRTAYLKNQILDTTAKSTHAYVVYKEKEVSENAVRHLNGKMFLERHLRFDSVSQPAKSDHKRSVFVGNIGFCDTVDDSTQLNSETHTSSSKNKPSNIDYEEGLWRLFSKAGPVENVRVIRDQESRVSKGFAYVQFSNSNCVEKAILFDGQRSQPMIPRKLRVQRARRA